MFDFIFPVFQKKKAVILLTRWILNHRKQLFAIINQVRLVEEKNTVIEEVAGMRKNVNRASTNARTDTGTNTGIVGMSESLWRDPSAWRLPRGVAREWSV